MVSVVEVAVGVGTVMVQHVYLWLGFCCCLGKMKAVETGENRDSPFWGALLEYFVGRGDGIS